MKTSKFTAYAIVFFFLLHFFSCPTCRAEPSVRERLNQIPYEDRKRIEILFSYLIYDDEPFAYTLFGTKPLTFTSCIKHFPYDIFSYHNYLFCLISDWKIWQKYQHLFPMKNYAFFSVENSEAFEIYLFNLSLCEKKIVENLKLFQKKLGHPDPFEQILRLARSGSDIFDGLGRSHALLGILLGFGTENSLYFENFYTNKMHYFLEDLVFFNTEPVISLFKICLPEFAVCESEETEQLRKDYTYQRTMIMERYSKKDVLEVTLSQLIQN